MPNPSYQILQDLISSNGGRVSASEAHGMLAGMLCADAKIGIGRWLAQVFGESRDGMGEGEEAFLLKLFGETQRSIGSVDFSFGLLLPDDDEALDERARALSLWCQGFLYGLGLVWEGGEWSEECDEILRDLTEISQLDSNASGEEDEEAYAEISEFVRVCVQLIHGDLLPSPSPSRHLH